MGREVQAELQLIALRFFNQESDHKLCELCLHSLFTFRGSQLFTTRHLLALIFIVTTGNGNLTKADIVISEGPVASSSTEQWWPSRWGSGDELGAANLLSPDIVLSAISLIRRGIVLDLSHPFEMGRPDFHHRVYTLKSAGGPSGGPVGKHKYIQ